MQRLRYTDVKDSLARVINVASTDSRVMQLANEAHRRLVQKGRWVGTLQRYTICTSVQGCMAWPRQIDTIEAYWLCDTPGTVRNGWFETSVNATGLLDGKSPNAHTLIDRGTLATFDSIDTAANLVQVLAAVPEAAGARLLLRGYDSNNQWIRTQEPAGSGQWIDGCYVAITTAPTFSPVAFAPGYTITEVIKPPTNGPVTLWQYDTGLAAATKQLAYYEPDETLPIYRASLIPGLGDIHGCGTSGCCGESSGCQSNRVTVIAKLRHIDVTADNDFFLLGNLGALKLMVMAILKEERNLFDEAMAYESKAIRELQDELNAFEGNGQVPIIKTESPQTWGANVLNPVTLGTRVY